MPSSLPQSNAKGVWEKNGKHLVMFFKQHFGSFHNFFFLNSKEESGHTIYLPLRLFLPYHVLHCLTLLYSLKSLVNWRAPCLSGPVTRRMCGSLWYGWSMWRRVLTLLINSARRWETRLRIWAKPRFCHLLSHTAYHHKYSNFTYKTFN